MHDSSQSANRTNEFVLGNRIDGAYRCLVENKPAPRHQVAAGNPLKVSSASAKSLSPQQLWCAEFAAWKKRRSLLSTRVALHNTPATAKLSCVQRQKLWEICEHHRGDSDASFSQYEPRNVSKHRGVPGLHGNGWDAGCEVRRFDSMGAASPPPRAPSIFYSSPSTASTRNPNKFLRMQQRGSGYHRCSLPGIPEEPTVSL